MRVTTNDLTRHVSFTASPTGRVTICVISEDEQLKKVLSVGIAVRSRKDPESSRKGMQVAMMRAMAGVHYDKPIRSEYWKKFNQVYPPPNDK